MIEGVHADVRLELKDLAGKRIAFSWSCCEEDDPSLVVVDGPVVLNLDAWEIVTRLILAKQIKDLSHAPYVHVECEARDDDQQGFNLWWNPAYPDFSVGDYQADWSSTFAQSDLGQVFRWAESVRQALTLLGVES